jgi:CRP-like cAMP-binding protein
MRTPLDALLASSSLHILPEEDLRASQRLWVSRVWPSDVEVWAPGEAAFGIALLDEGELALEVDGTRIGTVDAGEIVGEASAFLAEGVTLLTVRTLTPVRMLFLPATALRSLRWTAPALYDGLLELTTYGHARHLSAVRAELERRVRPGRPTPQWEPRASSFAPVDGRPSVAVLLRHLPGLVGATAATLAAIGACFTPQPVHAGEVVFRQGDARTSAWLIAEGEFDISRDVPRGRQRVARVAHGLLGIAALVDAGERTASCVAARSGWLYYADPDALAALSGEAWLAWRECLLGALSRQLMIAEDSLRVVRAEEHTPDREESFGDLLRASGWVGPVIEGLDELQVVPAPVWRRGGVGTSAVLR